jgi:hypothetical protein
LGHEVISFGNQIHKKTSSKDLWGSSPPNESGFPQPCYRSFTSTEVKTFLLIKSFEEKDDISEDPCENP